MSSDGSPSLEETVFRAHAVSGAFVKAVKEGKWRVASVNWPIVMVKIAPAIREGAPNSFSFRFDLTGYPSSPPTARPWSADGEGPLGDGRWPSGGQRVSAVFNPGWNNGVALYLPCDRLAAAGHPNWVTQYPYWIWSPTDTICKYLRIVHELLNSNEYSGIRERQS
jgi:hypothetical protein